MESKIFEEERRKSNIDRRALTHLVIRGKERFELYKNMQQNVLSMGLMNSPEVYELSRSDLFQRSMEHSYTIYKNVHVDNINLNYVYETVNSPNLHLKGSVGTVMVLQLILALGSEEQKKRWVEPIDKFKWATAYAQTEIAHGSDVEGNSTLAVYEPKTDSFVFNTPNLESIKWWPGDLALSASHIILIARLISNGQDHGVQPFFIQIRDLETLKLLPGIETGDIGPKLGYNSKDNGFMRLTNYRAPSFCLLSKYTKISPDGTVTKTGNDRLKFTGMMRARTLILQTSYYNMFKCSMITTRYSLLRKQFTDSQNKEIRIFDYQLQRYKICKNLSKAYAMSLGLYNVMALIQKNEDAVQNNDFTYFQQVHLTLCMCKAFYTWWDHKCVIESMNACGGHGYSAMSGMVDSFIEMYPNQILEGENTLLCLQISRYLLTLAQKMATGNSSAAVGQFQYLINADALEEFVFPATKEAFLDFDLIIKLFQRNSGYFVKNTAMNFVRFNIEGIPMKDAFNNKMGIQLLNMAKCHSITVISENFYSQIPKITDQAAREAITSLAVIYTCELLNEFSINLVESGCIKAEHLTIINELQEEHIEKVTPHLLVLSEAFPIPDAAHGSAIAHSNGRPYENLYEWAKKYGTLNHFPDGVHPVIAKHKKLSQSERL